MKLTEAEERLDLLERALGEEGIRYDFKDSWDDFRVNSTLKQLSEVIGALYRMLQAKGVSEQEIQHNVEHNL